jgi:DNA-binding transcriptional LysR family regulator
MVNFEYYKVFYHVARLGSITLAAGELFISQPAVSQAIKQLESCLGGSLFYRTPKGMRLTNEGELLYSYVSKGYEYLVQGENKYRELSALETGEIRIGASDMTLQFYLLPYLEQFNRQYPGIRIKVTNAPTPDTLKYLASGRIDFGAVSSPVTESKGLSVTPVCRINDIFVAGSRFEELKGRTVEFSELVQYPLVYLEQNTSTRKHIDSFIEGKGTKLIPEFELATSELIVQFAARGLGVGCVVCNFAEKQLADETLFEVRLKAPIPEREICIVTLDRMPMSPAGKRLLEVMLSKT